MDTNKHLSYSFFSDAKSLVLCSSISHCFQSLYSHTHSVKNNDIMSFYHNLWRKNFVWIKQQPIFLKFRFFEVDFGWFMWWEKTSFPHSQLVPTRLQLAQVAFHEVFGEHYKCYCLMTTAYEVINIFQIVTDLSDCETMRRDNEECEKTLAEIYSSGLSSK